MHTNLVVYISLCCCFLSEICAVFNKNEWATECVQNKINKSGGTRRSIKFYDADNFTEPYDLETSCTENVNYQQKPSIDLMEVWRTFSIFSMESSTNISQQCVLSLEKLNKEIQENNLDALKVFDATGKLSSGILRGNVNQFGDFDECLSVDWAQYCLAEIDLQSVWQAGPYKPFENMIQSHYAIRETFDDVKHRVPGFTMVRWGFCIPNSCTNTDLEVAIKEIVGLPSSIRPQMCQKTQGRGSTILHKNEKVIFGSKFFKEMTLGGIITRLFFGSIILLTIIASLRASFGNEHNSSGKLAQMVECFNVEKNWNILKTVKADTSNKDIHVLHGIRALSALALLMSHKTMALFYNPYMNRSVMTENLGMSWSVIGRTAIIYTDCFMLISGFLNANALFSELERSKTMKFKDKLINRIFRISPNIIAVILFCTYILPDLGAGPLWPTVVEHHSNLCKKFMWRNIFYIHNYYGFNNMCLTHTHQVGIDMQLFLITPILVYLTWTSKKIGLWTIGVLAVLSTFLRVWATWTYSLSHVVHFGISISRMFDTANYSYILPTHRATIYLIGVYLAYALKRNKVPTFSKAKLTFLWTFFLTNGFMAWLGPVHMSRADYKYNMVDALIYGALSPISWGAAVAWTIYATQKGFGGFFGDMLSWRKFEYFTKISYSVYLVQFPLFFYNVGITKHIAEFKPYLMLQIPETLSIILISIVLTLFIEIPFQNLKRATFDKVEAKAIRKEKFDLNQNTSHQCRQGLVYNKLKSR